MTKCIYDGFMNQIISSSGGFDVKLTPSETHLYRYLIRNYKSASSMSIRELANESSVSTASVLRLARKFGYHSWNDFRDALQHNDESSDVFFHDEQEFRLNAYFDVVCKSSAFEKQLNRAAALIASEKEILFAGDQYGICACDAGITLFQNIGRECEYLAEHEPVVSRIKGTCAIVITGNSSKEKMNRLREVLPIGKIPVIVIYCGGEIPRFPCDLISCTFTKDPGKTAGSLIPAVHVLEQLQKRVKSLS